MKTFQFLDVWGKTHATMWGWILNPVAKLRSGLEPGFVVFYGLFVFALFYRAIMLQIVGLFLLLSGSQGIPLDQSGPLSTLGTGYNILFGNPEGDPRTGHIDPGVKTTRHIFDFTYEEQKVSGVCLAYP